MPHIVSGRAYTTLTAQAACESRCAQAPTTGGTAATGHLLSPKKQTLRMLPFAKKKKEEKRDLGIMAGAALFQSIADFAQTVVQ